MSRILGDVFQILNGNVGLGTFPRQLLDIQDGNIIVSGDIGIGITIPKYKLDVDGDINFNGMLYQFERPLFSQLRWYDTENYDGIFFMDGNVGIGLETPMYPLHVIGTSYLNGTIITNNNNINAGSGTITASTFSGTATKVSQNLIRSTYLTGTNYNGSVATTWAVDATTTATANKIVARDGFGNIYAANVGIGTTVARQLLDIQGGHAIISGNVGIGSTQPAYRLDVAGNAFINGTITTNNNNINAGTGTVTASTFLGTATKVSQDLIKGNYLTGTNYNGSVTTTWAVDATSTNTANKVVVRDASGNFSAGTITATLSGTATQVSSTLTRGSYLTGNDFTGASPTTWAVDATTTATAGKIVARDASAYIFASGVGIGTATARQLLDVQGGHAIISGNLGIGTTDPTVRLSIGTGAADVTSTLMFNSGDTATNTDKLYWTYVKNGSKIGHNAGWNVNHYAGQSNASASPSNGNFHFSTGGPVYNERLTILNNGNIGIGSSQPAYRLDVAGNAFINGTITTNNNNINAGTGTVTASTFLGTATKVSQDLIKGNYLTGTNYNGSVTTTWAVDADSANTANKVVVRDASGNFSAGTITATLSGTATQVSSTLTRGSYLTGNDFTGASPTTWAVDATTTATAGKIVARDASGMMYAANVGIGTNSTSYSLDVIGDIYASKTIYASNLQIAGSLNILNTTTSNTQQMIITNDGTGPALIVKQTGVNYVAQFYHDDTEVFTIADGGLIGINTSIPRAPLDIIGDTILTGNIGFGTTQPLARLYLRHFDTGIDDILRVDNTNTNTTSLMVNHNGNVGIGTSTPMYPFHVIGTSYLNGSIITNNNNINAGSGTVTAATFSGTATQVSSTLTRGSYLTGNDFTGASPTTWAVDATSTNTANKVVARDANGMIYVANVGIGTTSALYAVDVIGDVNFTGILRQSGVPYISSQWTTNGNNIYYSNGNVGIQTSTPLYTLDVNGSLRAFNVFASNLTVLGDTTILNTISSNTEQMVITNAGTGPALKVSQSGINSIAEFYDNESGLALMIANNGNIGIGSTTPYNVLDINGNMYINGTISTNNNNINAGSGMVTAATFSGTATKVSNNLSPSTYLVGTIYNGVAASSWSVDADTLNTANKVVARDASGNFSAGTIIASLTGTATQVSQDLIRGTYLTGTNYNGAGTTTWAVDADTANTANKVVVRDASGNFSAGTITATLSGTATKVSNDLSPSTYLVGTIYNGAAASSWSVDATDTNTVSKIVARDASGNFSAGTITATLSGTATQVSSTLTRGSYLTGNDFTGASPTTWAVDADTASTANKIVARDASGMIYAANIGIGTTSALYAVDVVGDVNFTGILRQSGTPYISSQWTTTGANIYYNSGNVGVGTTSPLYTIDTAGDINFTGNLYQNGTLFGGGGGSSQWTTTGTNIYYNSGNVGIGVTNPTTELYVNGTITTSNIVLLNAYTTNYQIAPLRNTFYIDSGSNSQFILNQTGYFGGYSSNVLIYVNNQKLTYYSDTFTDYTLSTSYNNITNTTVYTVNLTQPATFGKLVDITIWPQILQESLPNPMRLYQRVDVQTDFISTGSNIYYLAGNVGIGTAIPQTPLHVNGAITAGNTPFKIYTATGTLSTSGTELTVNLPTNTTVNSIFNLSGLTSNTATGDWIPFTTNNIYGGSYFNWNVGHYIHYTSNVIKLVSNDTTASKPFKLCIMSTS